MLPNTDTAKLLSLLDHMAETSSRVRDDPEQSENARAKVSGILSAIEVIRTRIPSMAEGLDTRTPISKIRVPATQRVRLPAMGTSLKAAVELLPAASVRQYLIIHQLLTKLGPLTDGEMSDWLTYRNIAHTPSGLRTRRKELTSAQWVRDTGITRAAPGGKQSTVWAAVPEMTDR